MTEREAMKVHILTLIDATAAEIADLEAQTAPVTPDCSLGRLTRLEVMGEQEVKDHALREAQKRLNRLRFALTRVDREDFGLCEECGEPIAPGRLQIMPESTLCIACATQRGR